MKLLKLTLIDPKEQNGLGRAVYIDPSQVLAAVNIERATPSAACTQIICRGGTAFLLLEAAADVAQRVAAATGAEALIDA